MKKTFFIMIMTIVPSLRCYEGHLVPLHLPFEVGSSCQNDLGPQEDWAVELDESLKIVKYFKEILDFTHPHQTWWFVPTEPGTYKIKFFRLNQERVITITARRYSLRALPFFPIPTYKTYF